MNVPVRLPRILVISGLVLMLIGAIDPLEGSLVILPGSGMIALGAFLGRIRRRALLTWAFVLIAIGVGVMFAMSAVGGFGGSTGRSMWWALVVVPYPVGWVMGLVGTILTLKESPKGRAKAGQPTPPQDGAARDGRQA